ncbi:CaM_binding domain-containing protein [Cephalotus follicularis]|uniref:CaM_binding domain-containing protein n=1 Tax=Cephalotus follicularis TaxID=3775 RepID=A0A1Q3BCE9_CEPFO|nr:CaM_binding domain-containing protein [Cephalotus follicularis]
MSAKAPIMREVYTKSPDSQNPMVNEVATEKEKNNKTSLIKLRPSPNSRSHISDTPETIKQVVSSPSGKVGFSSKQASSNVKEISLSEKHATSLKLKSGMEIRLPAKLAISLKPMMDKPLSSSGGLSGRRISDFKIEKSTGTLKVPVKRVLASPRAALSPKPSLVRVASINARKNRSLKVVSSLKDQKEMRNFESGQCIDELEQPLNDTVQEKTLYVIKMESDNKSLKSDEKESYVVDSSSPRSLSSLASSPLVESPFSSSRNKEHQEESENILTEAEEDSHSEYGETVNMKETESSEEEHEWRSRKGHSEGTDCQPVKLNFRRGKVVDIQSEHNTPRRLRFRRGRVLGDNQNVKGNHQGSFKRRGVSDGDTNDSKPDSVKVALRHQDVQGKKDSQGLLNNVIEETASKLVETRKSKVKALVGAFETVISLQESKLYANPLT